MDLSKSFLEFAQLGADWVLWLLILLSIVSVGVMIDRWIWFRAREVDVEELARELRGAYTRGELERFIAKHKDDPGIARQVVLRGLAERSHGPDAVAEAMHGERAKWRRAGEKNLIILGTLGNNVPFVGLFGTVLGIMNAFLLLSSKAAEAEKQVFDQIAEALAATAFGLIVAVPAVAFFNYFSRRLRALMSSVDESAHGLLALLYGELHAKREALPHHPVAVEPTAVEEPDNGGR